MSKDTITLREIMPYIRDYTSDGECRLALSHARILSRVKNTCVYDRAEAIRSMKAYYARKREDYRERLVRMERCLREIEVMEAENEAD